MAYIFLDESGQLTKSLDSDIFLVGSFTTRNHRRTEHEFRAWQHSKFPRKLRYLAEIKYANHDINEELKIKTLKMIANLDIRIRYTYLHKRNIPGIFKHKDSFRTGHLYTEIVGQTLEGYMPITDSECRVFCDMRNLKGLTKSEFISITKTRLRPKLTEKTIIQLEMIDSTTNANIQIADWVCGALSAYHNNKQSGQLFYDILRNNLLSEGMELFCRK